MGEAEAKQFESWVDQLAAANDPLDFWYEHVWSPDIDHRAMEGAPDDVGPINGRDAMRAYVADWYEMFPDLEIVPEEIVDAGPERVLVVWHIGGTAKASGVPTELRYAAAYTIPAPKLARRREHITTHQ